MISHGTVWKNSMKVDFCIPYYEFKKVQSSQSLSEKVYNVKVHLFPRVQMYFV